MTVPTVLKLCCLIVAMSTNGLVAQAPSLTGKWAVSATAVEGKREGGGRWRRSALTTDLVLQQTGETLKGTFTGPIGDEWRLGGRVNGNTFELESDLGELPGGGGRPTSTKFRWRFRGAIDGDRMKGTIAFGRTDEELQRLQPFTATRRK